MRFKTIKICGLLLVFLIGISFIVFRYQKPITEPSKGMRVFVKDTPVEIINGEFLILLNLNDPAEIELMLQSLNLKLVMPIMNWILVEATDLKKVILPLKSDDTDEANARLNTLRSHKFVLDAHHNFVLPMASLKTDVLMNEQVRLFDALDLENIWHYAEGTASVQVAVVDDFLHDQVFTFQRRFSSCMDRVEHNHPFSHLSKGEHQNAIPHGEMSLLILGACNNQKGFSQGMDKKSRLLAVERSGVGHAQSFLALLWASGIDVCQESILPCHDEEKLIPPHSDIVLAGFGQSAPELLQFSADMISAISEQGTMVVTAAGNQGSNGNNFFPGGSPGTLNIGSHDDNKRRSLFSNWGYSVLALAQGENVNLIYPDGKKLVEGTSIAASFGAGLLSLMKSLNSELSINQANAIIYHSGDTITCKNCCTESLFNGKSECDEQCFPKDALCQTVVINSANALALTRDKKFPWPIVGLNNYYLLFSRDDEKKSITIFNEGDQPASIKVLADDIFNNANQEITLAPHSRQELVVSFKKIPYKRRTFQIALNEKTIQKTVYFFVEYIPK